MAKLQWDAQGSRFYETGVSNCVLYVRRVDGDYDPGVAWNGITTINETPEGAEATDIYADDVKYLTLRSPENFKASIEAYTYPDEFMPCEGVAIPVPGVYLYQQPAREFAICYKTILGNDVSNDSYGYIIHIIYNCLAAPSEKAYQTINDNPEAISFSWEVSTLPVTVSGRKPTSFIRIDSTKVTATDLAILEKKLYGTDSTDPTLLFPDDITFVLTNGYLVDNDGNAIIFGEDRILV